MDKKRSNDLVYYIKGNSNEETKKKHKKNINSNNFQKNYQKSNQKVLFSKKAKIEVNYNDKKKSTKNCGQNNEDSSPTKETINSHSKKRKNTKINTNRKVKDKPEVKVQKEKIKMTPKKRYYEENKKEKITKNNANESSVTNENEDDLVTSFERKPSELKSPHTISEDSFTSSYEEEKSKDGEEENSSKDDDESFEKVNNKNKSKSKNKNKKIAKRNSHTYSELVDNELIYVDRISANKDDEEEDKVIDKKNKNKKEGNKKEIKNNRKIQVKISELDSKDKNLTEKELKEKERDKKKEKFKNIEIKTKMTTRRATFMKNNNINKAASKTNNNNKILVNKSTREFPMKTERDVSTHNINNLISISNKNSEEKIPYIPVNQRRKLTVNKKLINITKTDSLNFNESELPTKESIKKNEKEKLYLSNFKKKGKKIFGEIKANTEQKNKYKKKCIKENYIKDNYCNTNMNKENVDNIKYNMASISNSNRKYKDSKNGLENKIFNNLSHTLEISDEYYHSKRRNKIDMQNDKTNKENLKNEKSEYYPKKNIVLLTKKTNNKLEELKNYKLNKPQSTSNIPKKNASNSNSNKIIYEPKKLGVIRVRSSEKAGTLSIYNNMSYDPNQYLNSKIKNTLYSENKKKVNNLNSSLNAISNKENLEEIILKKNSESIQKKLIELNNSYSGIGQKKPNYNIGLFNSTVVGNINNLHNLSSILNSNYDIGKMENMGNTNNNYFVNYNKNKIKDSLFLNKMNDKNNSASNLTNLLNPNEKNSLNNYYDNANQSDNNLMVGNLNNNLLFHHNSSCDIGLNEQMKNLNNRTQLINLIGNNFLGPNIVQNTPTNNLNNSIGNINNFNLQNLLPNNYNIEQNNVLSINFEDLIILQEYLREIIICLNKNKMIGNECFEYWNYYYNSSICCQLEKLFANPLDSNAVRISINYTLMSIMLCYDYSYEIDLLNKVYATLSDILKLNYKNLILICEHILSKITKESLSNIWVLKLSTIVNASNFNDYNQFLLGGYNMTIVERISYNTNIIVQNLRFLLKNFKSGKNDILTSMFKKIREKTYEEINSFFREKILRITNLNGSILGSVFLLKNNNFRTLPSPYVRTKNNKEFSLVLDLDETLINFKPKNNGEEGGVLRVRPGINEFLDEVGKYYELIIFTTATQDYADALIDAVEEDKIYFDHRLYREHAIIIGNDFIKDLTRIGRPLDKIIIVDNMPQNFRLQKENGIIIKAFWGEDSYDTVLYDLYPILVNIAKEGGDVRKSLVKYKDEIVKKVTSCISKSDL